MISSIYAAVCTELNLSLSVFKSLSVSNTVREVSHIAHNVSEFSKKHNKTSKILSPKSLDFNIVKSVWDSVKGKRA